MIVADANIVLAALRSSKGASHWLVRNMLTGQIPFAVSSAVGLEYEDVLKRPGILGLHPWIRTEEIDVLLDALFSRAFLVAPWFRFRPFMDDPKDDMYIECALAAGARVIVSIDRDFEIAAVRAFGITVLTPGAFVAGWKERRQEK